MTVNVAMVLTGIAATFNSAKYLISRGGGIVAFVMDQCKGVTITLTCCLGITDLTIKGRHPLLPWIEKKNNK